jgi:2-C-methyl-D-erythritol 4-phosphate cytidylyltransferase
VKKYAVIVAGGKGVRMGTAMPKQFLDLGGHPVLYHTIKAFVDAYEDMHLVLVLPTDQLSYAQMVLQSFPERIDITIVAGGETRYHSVQNGLKAVEGEAIIFVHDGVRPLVMPALIQRCYETALDRGTAIPAIPVADSMRIVDGDDSDPVDREAMRIIQTPQTFRSDVLLPAFAQEWKPSFTDEATVVEAAGTDVVLVEGERSNIKVTTPEDLLIAEALLNNR